MWDQCTNHQLATSQKSLFCLAHPIVEHGTAVLSEHVEWEANDATPSTNHSPNAKGSGDDENANKRMKAAFGNEENSSQIGIMLLRVMHNPLRTMCDTYGLVLASLGGPSHSGTARFNHHRQCGGCFCFGTVRTVGAGVVIIQD